MINKNKIFIILLVILFKVSVVAQEYGQEQRRQIDSLHTLISENEGIDTAIIKGYLDLASLYYLTDVDTAIYYCEKSKKMSDEIQFLFGQAESCGWLGYLYDTKGDLEKALHYYESALALHEKRGDKNGMATNYNNIGYIYNSLGDIPLALDYFHKGLMMNEKLGDKEAIAYNSINIGTVFYYQDDEENALLYYNKSLDLLKDVGNTEAQAPCLNNAGLIYLNQDSLEKALKYFNESLELEKLNANKEGMATCYSNIGLYYIRKGDVSKGIEYYDLSLKLEKELGNKRGVASSLRNIGDIYFKQGDYKKAFEYGVKSLQLSKELGFPENIKSGALLLSDIYEQNKEGMKALEMYKLYITMRDSINNAETQQASAQEQAKYTYEKQKAIDDATHEKQKALDKAESEKLLAIEREEKQSQQFIIYSATIGLVLLVGFLLFVFNRLKITKRQKAEIDKQKDEIESAHEQLAEHHKEISDSIVYAKSLQQAILPSREELNKELKDGFVLFKPKDVVSGDFYWMEKVGDTVFFAAADCTGHGVPGAMVSVVCSNALDRAVKEFGILDPGKILDKVTDLVIERFEKSGDDVRDGMDISLCALNWDKKKVSFSGANNPMWLIRSRKDDKVLGSSDVYNENYYLEEYKGDSQPIGKFDRRVPFTTIEVDLLKGDSLYLFTDGYADQFGGIKGKKFKYKPFKNLLVNSVELAMEEQQDKILNAFIDWKGDLEQIDDVCVIGLRI